jgi:hypothetical protein
MKATRRWIAASGVLLGVVAGGALALPGAATAGPVTPKAFGKGVDTFRLAFAFKAKDPGSAHGHAFFETNSFGDQEGDVDCLEMRRHKAALSGLLDTPTSGLTHFMLIVKDRNFRHPHRRDLFVSWLRTGSFDCHTEGFGDTFDESMKKIRKGNIFVVG